MSKKKLACRRKPFRLAPVNTAQGYVASWLNDYFFVQIKYVTAPSGNPNAAVLAIQTVRSANKRDGQNDITWADKQWIKNTLVGPEFWAVEMFPAESALSDVADIYWLWVYPPGENPEAFDLSLGLEVRA